MRLSPTPTRPIDMETRVPKMTRLSMSRPSLSAPDEVEALAGYSPR